MIRKANLSDFESVRSIKKSLALDVSRVNDTAYRDITQQSGFLLPLDLSLENFTKDLSFYSVAEDDGTVVGYFKLRDTPDLDTDTEEIHWSDPKFEDRFFSNPHTGLDAIGVYSESGRHGLATSMLQSAEKAALLRNSSWLFSFVVISPLQNLASMKFHEKNGFERAGVLEPTTYTADGFSLENFQSILYAKKLG